MIPVLPLGTCLAAHLLLGLVNVSMLRWMWPGALARRAVGAVFFSMGLLIVIAHVAWKWGTPFSSHTGVVVGCVSLVLSASIAVSHPVTILVRLLGALAKRVGLLFGSLGQGATSGDVEAGPEVSPGIAETVGSAPERRIPRRAMLRNVAVLPTVAGFGAGLFGFAEGSAVPGTPRVAVTFAGLHPDLEGFTLLQLSDLHLGVSRHIADLEALLNRLDKRGPRVDMIVCTGDMADDTRELGPALALVRAFPARFGAYAALGNHEYLHEIRSTRPIYEASGIPLLVNTGRTLRIGGANLHVAGIDDPITTHADISSFLQDAVKRALRSRPDDAFSLLLSHRPEGFDAAAASGVSLTLSGHTHGGQIGYNGKSAFQPLWPERYLWGPYCRGPSRLYTTCGFGAWFPFRLGCPAEAPLIVLSRGAADGRSR